MAYEEPSHMSNDAPPPRLSSGPEPMPILFLGIVLFAAFLFITWTQKQDSTPQMIATVSTVQARLNTVAIIHGEFRRAERADPATTPNWWQYIEARLARQNQRTILDTAEHWLDASLKSPDGSSAARRAGNAAALYGLGGDFAKARQALLRAEKVDPSAVGIYHDLLPLYSKPALPVEMSPQLEDALQHMSAGALLRARDAHLRRDARGELAALRAGVLQSKRILQISSFFLQISLLIFLSALVLVIVYRQHIRSVIREVALPPVQYPIWGVGTAFIVITLLFVAASLLSGLFSLSYIVFRNVEGIPQFLQFLFFGIAEVISAIVILGMFLRLLGHHFFDWNALGWRVQGKQIRYALLVLLITYPLIMLASLISTQLFKNNLEAHPILPVLQTTNNPIQVLLLVSIAIILAPVIEETLFRGVLFPALQRHFSFWNAALLSGFIFASIHAQFVALLPITVLGVLFAFLIRKTDNLWAPAIAHAAFNAISISVALLLGWALRSLGG